jgi:hypothetical protein
MKTTTLNNTEKLLNTILSICNYTQGEICITNDGVKYRHDHYVTKYPSVFNSIVNLFDKAAKENNAEFSTQFFYNKEYSFAYDRPKFKGQSNGKISFSKLIILN